MKYGDYDNVTKDVKAINEIIGRQGSLIVLEVLAERIGQSVLRFHLDNKETENLKNSLILDLKEELNERT